MIKETDLTTKEDKDLFSDLSEYFKAVERCTQCKILYGVDNPKKDDKLCPNHTARHFNHEKRKKNRKSRKSLRLNLRIRKK